MGDSRSNRLLNIRNARSRTTANTNLIDRDLKGQKKSKDCKERGKSLKSQLLFLMILLCKGRQEMQIELPREKNQVEIESGLHYNYLRRGKERLNISGTDREEEIDPGNQKKNNDQKIEFNPSHKPPDQNPTTKETREKYEEDYHHMELPDTEIDTVKRGGGWLFQMMNSLEDSSTLNSKK